VRVVPSSAPPEYRTALLRALLGRPTDVNTPVRRRTDRIRTPYDPSTCRDRLMLVSARSRTELSTRSGRCHSVVSIVGLVIHPARDERPCTAFNVIGTRAVLHSYRRLRRRPHVVPRVVAWAPCSRPGPVDETVPPRASRTSAYSIKVTASRILDRFARAQPQAVLTRSRPDLVSQAGASEEDRTRWFIGPLARAGDRLRAGWPDGSTFACRCRAAGLQLLHAEYFASAVVSLPGTAAPGGRSTSPPSPLDVAARPAAGLSARCGGRQTPGLPAAPASQRGAPVCIRRSS